MMLAAGLPAWFLLILQLLAVAANACPEHWINCGNGKCLAFLWRCDGNDDCGNMKDEEDCDNPGKHRICLSSQFKCSDYSNCIPMSWLCDGHPDCKDYSDEANCTKSTCEGFHCAENHCIPGRWRCDNQKDCSDGSDEAGCPKDGPCTTEEFTCSSGSCLPMDKVCNNKTECSDGSDEGARCVDTCENYTCSQGCKHTPNGPSCFCSPGYTLNADNITCSDVDECLQDGICSHKCRNTPGSYKCTCLEGYELINGTCFAKGEGPLLIFATQKEIRAMDLRSGQYFPVLSETLGAATVDFDPRQQRVYWITVSVDGSSVYSSQLDGSSYRAVTHGFLTPEDVAVDYITRNIYVTDSGLLKIIVCSIDLGICHVLHQSDLDKPRALALDLEKGLMYWCDWGKNAAGIHRSGMDGSGRTALVSKDIYWPNGIAIDHSINRLYWVDVKQGSIEYITLDGKTRKIVLKDEVFHPYSLAVFEDTLYWTDWETFSLDSCNKFTGHKQNVLARENGKRIMGVHVYHPALSVDIRNPCWRNGCSHICIMGPQRRAKCACPSGFHMSVDNKTCSLDKDVSQILIAVNASLFQMLPEAVGNNIYTTIPVHDVGSIGGLALNQKDKILYISNSRNRTIVELNMQSGNQRVLVKEHIKSPEGLAYDVSGNNLYWTDSVKGTVEVFSIKTHERTVLLQNLSRPLDIVLASDKGYLFVATTGGNTSHIVMYDMDGNNKREIPDIKGIPVSLALHPELPMLYWADRSDGTLNSVDYLISKSIRKIHKRNLPFVTSVAVNEGLIYWMETIDNKIFVTRQNDTKLSRSLLLIGDAGDSVIRRIKYISGSERGLPSCSTSGCSDICLIKPSGYKCACPVHKSLHSNGLTCILETHKQCSSDEFKCTSNECQPLDYKCDGSKDCADGSDEANCDELDCPEGDFECQNGRCIEKAWVCDNNDDCTDGSDEEGCAFTDQSNCTQDKFPCGNGKCVPHLWRCDGEKDCENNLDEENCHVTECDDAMLRCDNGQCIPTSWMCDGAKDCKDGTDERPERCGVSTPGCSMEEYQCPSGFCIDKVLVCNQREDCEDGSDEKNCSNGHKCKNGMFLCSDGMCVRANELCDGYEDCSNDEELNCTLTECANSEFYCSSTMKCIPKAWLCDGDDDCGDAADEKLNACHYRAKTTPATVKSNQCGESFQCESGECISWNKVCNGKPDCKDYSDEGILCEKSCGLKNGGCSQLCLPSPQGPKCTCIAGYKLHYDGKTCDDINECLILGLCNQFCNNTKGKFKCSCAEGYFLTGEHKCKAEGNSATLFFLLLDEIRGLELGSNSERVYMEVDRAYMKGIDYDAMEGVLFWTEWKEGTINSFKLGSKRNDIIIHGLHRPIYLKYDWITKTIYFNNGMGSIIACTRNGEYCTTVVEFAERSLSGLAIAPVEGYLFWSVWKEARNHGLGIIERTDTGGLARTQIVTTKTYWPTSVTVDHVLSAIYWTDNKLNILESANFHGQNRRVVVRDNMYHPYAMAVFEDFVYWADWGTDSIMRCNKFVGDDCLQLHKKDLKTEAMVIAHKVYQIKGTNRCRNSSCPQMCLQSPTGFYCRCDRKYNLINGTCTLKAIKPVPVKRPSTIKCPEDFCANGECIVNGESLTCSCSSGYFGERCDKVKSRDYSWIAAVLFGLFAIIITVLIILICRQDRGKLLKIGNNIAVTFRNPRYTFRKKDGLVADTDDGTGADELMLGQKGDYTPSGFGNPLFNQRTVMDITPEDGYYKKWPSCDSEDSAFVSECATHEGSTLTIDQTSISSSKSKIVNFFRRI